MSRQRQLLGDGVGSKDAPYRIVRRESFHFPQLGSGRMAIELARIGNVADE